MPGQGGYRDEGEPLSGQPVRGSVLLFWRRRSYVAGRGWKMLYASHEKLSVRASGTWCAGAFPGHSVGICQDWPGKAVWDVLPGQWKHLDRGRAVPVHGPQQPAKHEAGQKRGHLGCVEPDPGVQREGKGRGVYRRADALCDRGQQR